MKSGELPIRIANWPAYWRELYEERAGIMEHQANMPKDVAERNAEANIRWQFQQAQ
jgi:hypothetical protein